jgi:phosphohistidine phosphatase SixA
LAIVAFLQIRLFAGETAMLHIKRRVVGVALLLALVCNSGSAQSQDSSGTELLKALQAGGQVIVMRHASSPRVAPSATTANPDNTALERQLDETGRITATAMGKALRDLKIPVGAVLSSPTYRALETVRLAQLPTAKTYPELGDGGQSMAPTSKGQSNWLQQQAAQFPKGSNTIVVTHSPNISAAFPDYSGGLAEGEALIFGPDGKGGSALLARIKIEDWPKLGK